MYSVYINTIKTIFLVKFWFLTFSKFKFTSKHKETVNLNKNNVKCEVSSHLCIMNYVKNIIVFTFSNSKIKHNCKHYILINVDKSSLSLSSHGV